LVCYQTIRKVQQYNPIYLKHLLQLSCWRIKQTTTSRGFEALVSRIKLEVNQNASLSVKYLSNLMTDINNAISRNEMLSKQNDFIDELLSFCSYNNWDEFLSEYDAVKAFLHGASGASSFEEERVIILTTREIEERIKPYLSFQSKYLERRVLTIHVSREETVSLKEELQANAFIITLLRPEERSSLYHKISRKKFTELKESGRLVPVWQGSQRAKLNFEFLTKSEHLIGDNALLLALLIIGELQETSTEKDFQTKKLGVHIKVKSNRGIVSSGEVNIEGPAISGGTVNVNYGKKED